MNSTKYLLFFAVAIIILLSECAPKYKITYNLPQNVPEPAMKELMSRLDKGKELYKSNCSDCHGIFTKGKDKIPNFTNAQIDNYASRFLRRDPQNHAILMQMAPDQF